MAYVIAEPCIGTKDTRVWMSARWTAFIRARMKRISRAKRNCISIPRNASIAERASGLPRDGYFCARGFAGKVE